MADIQRLIIGWIPRGCSSEYISPGDPDGSETNEVIIDLENQRFSDTQKNLELDISLNDLWNPASELWDDFVSTFCNKLSNGQSTLHPITVGQLWGYFNEEQELPDGVVNLQFNLLTGGDIENKCEYCDGQHWYVQFYNVDVVDYNEEIYDEKLTLVHSSRDE
jgi:hypothetical protein